MPRARSAGRWASLAVILVLALGLWWVETDGGEQFETSRGADPVSGLPWVTPADLPVEAAQVLRAIDNGGPYVREKDGSTFGNFERVLPARPRGYYREYTVPTLGVDHAGARRIVSGAVDEFYWTADHYETFARIRR